MDLFGISSIEMNRFEPFEVNTTIERQSVMRLGYEIKSDSIVMRLGYEIKSDSIVMR